jgi:hypothetical protein
MTYTKNREGYLIPSLSLPNQPNPYLNRYARLRLDYLEQNEPTLCDQLMLEGTLLTSCSRIGRTAQRIRRCLPAAAVRTPHGLMTNPAKR